MFKLHQLFWITLVDSREKNLRSSSYMPELEVYRTAVSKDPTPVQAVPGLKLLFGEDFLDSGTLVLDTR